MQRQLATMLLRRSTCIAPVKRNYGGSSAQASNQVTDPNNYNVPVRVVTMDDTMEPYGSWKTAYEKEIKRGNKLIIKGVIALTSSIVFMYYSGTTDGLFMPNLDNIMEDTEPFDFDKEDRVTV